MDNCNGYNGKHCDDSSNHTRCRIVFEQIIKSWKGKVNAFYFTMERYNGYSKCRSDINDWLD